MSQIANAFVRTYLTPLVENSSITYIDNVETQATLFTIDDIVFPACINKKEYDSSYVCSIYNALVSYGSEEANKISNPLVVVSIKAMMAFWSFILKAGSVNQNIFVNNYLLSTNLYPRWRGEGVNSFTEELIHKYPNHAIIFRSLNEHTNAELLKRFEQCDYDRIATRQVYIFDEKLRDYRKSYNFRQDIKFLQQSHYRLLTHDDITAENYPRIVELYDLLYIKKYSIHNPKYNQHMIAHWHQQRLLKFFALQSPDGSIDGVIGCFENDEFTTAPLVGYDTALAQELGLYRMLMAIIIDYSAPKILNLSSGAPRFKRNRGGQPFIEYAVIYTKHLPIYRRLLWLVIKFVLNKIFIPLVRKFKL